MQKRTLHTTYYDQNLDELVGDEDDSVAAAPNQAPQKAFDFSALFQAANSISLEVFDESFKHTNEWPEFNYIPTVQDLFPSYNTNTNTNTRSRQTLETPFKLSFNKTTSTQCRSRNLSEEQAFLEMQQCVGLSAKKRLDYSFNMDNIDTLPRAVSYSSDLSSADDNTNIDAGGYRESPLKRVESRSSLSRMNSAQSISKLSMNNARPSLNKNYKSSPNIRLGGESPRNALTNRASSSRLSKSSRFSALGDLPENNEKNTADPPAPKTLNSRMDNLKKRHDALLKDLNQTSRRHEKLLAKSSSRQSLKQ